MEFQAYEDRSRRAVPETRTNMVLYRRVYDLPTGAIADIPTKGATVTLRDVTGSGLATPRVYDTPYAQATDTGKLRVTVVYYQIRLYSGQSYELAGSRQTSTDGQIKRAIRLFVTTDGSTGLPSKGSLYPDELGDTSRRRVGLETKPEVFPGLYYHIAHYIGFESYA